MTLMLQVVVFPDWIERFQRDANYILTSSVPRLYLVGRTTEVWHQTGNVCLASVLSFLHAANNSDGLSDIEYRLSG